MLDTTTKKRIDDCRDILVGKLPDPKAQIEQITIALIYKFMDDMDKEAIELGGVAKFFSGNFEKYSWDNLFDTKVTATEMLNLYSDAIASMDKNPNIPQLFRDIFKNAFLPYRDPETLKMFLKTIGEFAYTHSEKLGDAFEYLLSVMGSQGDAGQFRTPRHIIDFLVAVVNPAKTDTILDPACGTAGFLISAFKYIMDSSQEEKLGSGVTPDDRRRIISNLTGYDISPDMVRLSLVNLYLHGFSDPHIYEYDTLSSEDRWNETFDVILANPPFMSPKGGIRPHKKFSISSNRSEVLFVDYIAEHLNPGGKAGIIVPEGVIFQSGTAYKDLRKMLIDNYLYAVVSLPAGVFNPYSGVKTSILLMDKEFAKTNEEILFVKIDNDGYGLGAQRNAVKGGQLAQAIEVLKQFKEGSFTESTLAHSVPKAEIAKNGDYNLSGERYKISTTISSSYEFVKLADVCLINPETIEPTTLNVEEFVYVDISSVENGTGKINFENTIKTNEAPSRARRKIAANDILLSTVRPNLKAFGFVSNIPQNTIASTGFAVLRVKDSVISKYLFYNLFSEDMVNQMVSMMGRGSYPSINQTDVASLQIPLPPLSIQHEIVSEIESYQKIIDGAKMVVENYKPKIEIDEDWEMVELGEVLNFVSSGSTPKGGKEIYTKEGVLFIRSQNVLEGHYDFSDCVYISEEIHAEMKRSQVKYNDVFLNITGASIGRSAVMDKKIEANVNQHVALLRCKDSILPFYLSLFLNSENGQKQISGMQAGASREALNYAQIKQIKVPIPPLQTQLQIVTRIEKEQELVNANKQLIEIFEQKIKDRIGKVWGTTTPENKTLNPSEPSFSIAAEPDVEYGK